MYPSNYTGISSSTSSSMSLHGTSNGTNGSGVPNPSDNPSFISSLPLSMSPGGGTYNGIGDRTNQRSTYNNGSIRIPYSYGNHSVHPGTPSTNNSSGNVLSSDTTTPSTPTLGTPSIAAATTPGTIKFSPMPGILPEVIFTPVIHIEIRIGESTVRVLLPTSPNHHPSSLSSPSPGTNCWVKVHDINRTNQGKIFIVAKATLAKDGQWYYVLQDQDKHSTNSSSPNNNNPYYYNHNPSSAYVLRAVKREEKTRIVTAQGKLSVGEHCDNSILERALLLHLHQLRQKTKPLSSSSVDDTSVPPSYVLEECWHDDLYLYSLTDYVPNGDLFQYCANLAIRGQTIAESVLRTIIKDVLLGLRILHQQGFTHRDISPENILLADDYSLSSSLSSSSSSATLLVSSSARKYRGILIDYGSALPMPPDPSVSVSPTHAFTGLQRSTSLGSRNSTPIDNSMMVMMETENTITSTTSSSSNSSNNNGNDNASTMQGINNDTIAKRTNSGSKTSSFIRLKRSLSGTSESSSPSTMLPPDNNDSFLLTPSTTNHSTLSHTSLSSSVSTTTPTIGRGGWLPLSPPKGSPFCKPSYACPYYIWGKQWYGIAYDLYSIGATLYTAMNGKPFYMIPNIHDYHFQILLEADRKFSKSLIVMNPQTLQNNYFHHLNRQRSGHFSNSSTGNLSQQSTSNMSVNTKDDHDLTIGMGNLHMNASPSVTGNTNMIAKRQSSSSFSSKKKYRSHTHNSSSSSSTTVTEYVPDDEATDNNHMMVEDTTIVTASSSTPTTATLMPSSTVSTTTVLPVLLPHQPQTSMAIHLPPPPPNYSTTAVSMNIATPSTISSSSSYTNSIHITPTSIIYNTVDANYTDTFLEYLKLHNRYERINRGKIPISPSLCDLIAKLLRISPMYRPVDVDTVLAHPWFDETN